MLRTGAERICRFRLNGTFYACPCPFRTNKTRDANVGPQDNHYIVFCPRYYEYPSLYETLSVTDALPVESLLVLSAGKGLLGNQAEFYFHESLVCSRG